jgi:hypothetical protein
MTAAAPKVLRLLPPIAPARRFRPQYVDMIRSANFAVSVLALKTNLFRSSA